MSYARFGDPGPYGRPSDVYVFFSVSGYYECCGCKLHPKAYYSTVVRTAKQMRSHLVRHLDAGHVVPERAFTRLNADIEGKCASCSGREQIEPDEDEWDPCTCCVPEGERIVGTRIVLALVEEERERQEEKWGRQRHPDGTGPVKMQQAKAEGARAHCEIAAKGGFLTWEDILAEEVAEAGAEKDLERLRREVIQVAAVAVAWVEDLNERLGVWPQDDDE